MNDPCRRPNACGRSKDDDFSDVSVVVAGLVRECRERTTTSGDKMVVVDLVGAEDKYTTGRVAFVGDVCGEALRHAKVGRWLRCEGYPVEPHRIPYLQFWGSPPLGDGDGPGLMYQENIFTYEALVGSKEGGDTREERTDRPWSAFSPREIVSRDRSGAEALP